MFVFVTAVVSVTGVFDVVAVGVVLLLLLWHGKDLAENAASTYISRHLPQIVDVLTYCFCFLVFVPNIIQYDLLAAGNLTCFFGFLDVFSLNANQTKGPETIRNKDLTAVARRPESI